MTRTRAPPSGERQQGDPVPPDVLVARIDPLVGGGQVDPELDAVEQAAAGDQGLRRSLDVEDARSGRHPLGVAVGDEAAAAGRVPVLEGAVDHVGHGLEAPVGMPGRALRLTGRVLDLAHLVHVHEGIETIEGDAGEGPVHREAFPLEARRRGGDGLDRPAWPVRARVRADAGQ